MLDDKFSTEHSELRLMQRAREFDKSLTELWQEGVECEVAYHGYDEARVVPSRGIVMLVENNQVVTILDDLHNVTVKGKDFQDFLGDALDGGFDE